jgi:hypothetical protein
VRERACQDRGFAHAWLCALTLTFIAALIVNSYAPTLAVTGSLVCVAVVWRSLSTLVRSYIAYIVLSLVIAPRFSGSIGARIETAEMLGALWIAAASLGGVLASLRKRRSKNFRVRPSLDPVAPALIVSTASLVAVFALRSSNSYGIAGQLATGVSGGGYLGLLAEVGPPMAAGALLSTLGRPEASKGRLVLSAGLVVLTAVSLTFSGFRGAAPSYIIAIMLCAVGVRKPSKNRANWRWVFGVSLVVGFIVGLFALGVASREDALSTAGVSQNKISLSNFLPTVIQRFDESTAISKAQEVRNDPNARRAVSILDQGAVIVPRFLYPAKGVVDYGHQVSVVIYGEPDAAHNSSTVTTFGDALINLGFEGAVALLVAYVFIFDTAFRRVGATSSVTSMSIRVAVFVALMDLEAPVMLSLISLVRLCLAIFALEWCVKTYLRIRPTATHSTHRNPHVSRRLWTKAENQCRG